MAGIDAFLQQNPELKDKDPVRVMQYVYDTQIKATGKSQARFEEYFLGAPVKSDSFLGDEYGDNFLTSGAKSLTRGAIDAFKGDATTDMGNLNSQGITGEGFGGQAKLAGSSILGSDEDVETELARQYPDATFDEDGNGNRFISMADGRQAYINKPGLDAEDVTRAAGKVLAFVPAGIAGMAAKGLGVASRALVGGTAAGATDAAMQIGAGRDEIDKGQVAITGALGAGTEALAPAVGAIAQGLAKRMGLDRWSRMAEFDRRALINRQLNRDGFNPDELASMSSDEIYQLGVQRAQSGDAVVPDAAIAERFGYQNTRGQAMPTGTREQRAARTEQLNREEYLKTKSEGQDLVDIDENNIRQHDANISRMVDEFTGGTASGSRNSAALKARDELQDAADASKQEYKDAYDVAASKTGSFDDGVMLGMPDRIRAKLGESDVILDDVGAGLGSRTPTTNALLREIENNPQSTMKGVENIRKKINAAMSDTKVSNPSDHRALKVAKDEFDATIDEAVDNALFTGDMDALKEYKNARALFAEHSRKYNSKDATGKVIQKMLDPEMTPESIANYMFGRSGLSKTNAATVVNRYAEAVGGKNTEAFKAVKEVYFESVLRGAGAQTKGVDGLITSMKNVLDDSGESATAALFTKKEISEFRLFVRALKTVQTDARRKNPSGSGAAVFRMLNGSRIGQLPGIRTVVERLESAGMSADVSRALNLPSPPATPISATPVTAGGYSASQ